MFDFHSFQLFIHLFGDQKSCEVIFGEKRGDVGGIPSFSMCINLFCCKEGKAPSQISQKEAS